jgi:hypothetical protein
VNSHRRGRGADSREGRHGPCDCVMARLVHARVKAGLVRPHVMAGRVPAIHDFAVAGIACRGSPRQACPPSGCRHGASDRPRHNRDPGPRRATIATQARPRPHSGPGQAEP